MIFPLRRAFLAGWMLLLPLLARADTPAPLKFDFGPGSVAPGWTQVLPDMTYAKERGFGFEPGATLTGVDRAADKGGGLGRRIAAWFHHADPLRDDFITSDRPFFFSIRVPAEGNYRVTVTLGDRQGESTTTIKAELRRLMVERIHTAPGQFATVSFIVNTRTPRITATGDIKEGTVKLKAPRESIQEAWGWDDLLTLEFNGARPAVCAVEIARVNVPTVFLIGDSTVCDQSKEPYNSWGQMLPRWFKPDIAIANHAESGETYRDSIGRRRLDKMLSVMKPGDCLIMQFGTNDQKQIAAGTGGPFTTYKAEIKQHVDAVRARGAFPIIISPVERGDFDAAGRIKPSLAEYAEASRQAAQELHVPFIDLNALSTRFYEALGPPKLAAAFAMPQTDHTHHNAYGSYELAQCIVAGIRQTKLPLAGSIVDDFHGFDPAHPDPIENFAIPPSPQFTNQRPLGD